MAIPASNKRVRSEREPPPASASAPARRPAARGPAPDPTEDPALPNCRIREVDGVRRAVLGPEREPWVLLKRLGHGGMGVVYKAVEPGLGSPVAIKVLSRDLEFRKPVLAERFQLEARIAAQAATQRGIDPAHLVRVFKVGRDHGRDHDPADESKKGVLYFVMEYVDGLTAAEWIRDSWPTGAPERDALDVCIAATAGLKVLHEATVNAALTGTVHRDVKPANIFIPWGREGRPNLVAAKIGDLGLCCPEDSSHELTGDDAMMGTIGYASPEQLDDPEKVEKPADIFAMGATLYTLLTGSAPFGNGSPRARFLATLRGDYRRLRDVCPDVSIETDQLVHDCLTKRPADRVERIGGVAGALLAKLERCRRRLPEGGSGSEGSRSSRVIREGRIVVIGGPPGAAVVLRDPTDGSAVWESTVDADGGAVAQVKAANYRITVTDPSHEEFRALVAVSPNAEAEVRVERRLRRGTLDVDSDPQGAQVHVDDQQVRVTPVRGFSLAAGSHSIRVSHEGYVDWVQGFEVAPGAALRVGPVILQGLPVLDVPGLPPDATLELDGRPVRDGDRVAPGTHVLEARRRGFEIQRLELEFLPGSRVRPEFTPWRHEATVLLDDLREWDGATSAERESAALAIGRVLRGFVARGLHWFESGGVRHEIACFVHEATGIEFALLPGACAMLGSRISEAGHRSDERAHEAAIGPFLCARAPVSFETWRRVMGSESPGTSSRDGPACGISWLDAAEFCARAGLELPGEWQREYAARAGTTTPHSFGADLAAIGGHAWWRDNAGGRPRRSGLLAPNAFGLFDVHGNVADWCADVYCANPAERDAEEPVAPGVVRYQVFRGGTCRDDAEALRSAARGAFRATQRGLPIGVRPVLRIRPGVRRTQPTSVARVAVEPSAPTAPVVAVAEPPNAVPPVRSAAERVVF